MDIDQLRCDIVYGILIAVILLMLWYYMFAREGYESKKQKAETIYNWWESAQAPSYNRYKSDVDNSDIVEYYGSKKLKKSGELSVDNIMQIIK